MYSRMEGPVWVIRLFCIGTYFKEQKVDKRESGQKSDQDKKEDLKAWHRRNVKA